MQESGTSSAPVIERDDALSALEDRADRWAQLESRLSFISGYFVLGCALVALGFVLKVML